MSKNGDPARTITPGIEESLHLELNTSTCGWAKLAPGKREEEHRLWEGGQ